MKLQSLFIALLFLTVANGQNVGIGVTTPGFPLSFPNATGDKISLYGNTGNHYGFGIQSGLLQIHTDLPVSNIAFGHGASNNFTERMRIINNVGYDGMSLNGRLILKNGSTDLVGGGAGVWLYKADNTASLGFMGAQNNQNIGFYGGPGGWGFTYDAINSRVGIGNNNPTAPLSFGATIGKKLVLYPGPTGDYGFGIAGGRLQIFSENNISDVAIGYDVAGTFTERFSVKGTGAIAVNGSTGSAGQVLQSAGSGTAPKWMDKPYVLAWNLSQLTELKGAGVYCVDMPGLNNQTFTLQNTSSVVVTYTVTFRTVNIFQTDVRTSLQIFNQSNQLVAQEYAAGIVPQTGMRLQTTTTVLLPPGLYRMEVRICRQSPSTSGDSWADDAANEGQGTQVIMIVIPV